MTGRRFAAAPWLLILLFALPPIAPEPARGWEVEWSVCSVFPKGSFSSDLLRGFAEEIMLRSNEGFHVNLYTGGGARFPESELLKTVGRGVYAMGQGCGVIYGQEEPILEFQLGPPFAYSGTLEEVGRLIEEADLPRRWREAYARHGCRLLGTYTYGPYPVIMTGSRPLRRAEDFQGLRIRAIGPVYDLLEAMGAEPRKTRSTRLIPFRSSPSRGTGTTYSVDAVRGLRVSRMMKFYNLPHWNDWHFGDLFVNAEAYDKLKEEYRRYVREAAEHYFRRVEESYIREARIVLEHASSLGYEVITMPEPEVEKVRRTAVEEIWPRYAAKCGECAEVMAVIRRYHGMEEEPATVGAFPTPPARPGAAAIR